MRILSDKRRPPRAAIFDVEGTLIDCAGLVLQSWSETLHAEGHSLTVNDLQPYSGMDGAWMLEQLLPRESPERRNALIKAQGEHYRSHFMKRARPFPGVNELLDFLRRAGVAIGIATSCQADEFASYDQELGVSTLVDRIICGEEVRHGKPDPELFRLCLRGLDIPDPSTAVAIGDTPSDALAANALGMRSVGMLTGGFLESSLIDAGHEAVFLHVSQIRALWNTVAICH